MSHEKNFHEKLMSFNESMKIGNFTIHGSEKEDSWALHVIFHGSHETAVGSDYRYHCQI